MKYFIYGARRSGKTTYILNLLQKMDSSIVWETIYSRRQEYSRVLGGRKISTISNGLRDYVRVYDDIQTYFRNLKDINSLKIFHPILTDKEVEELTIKNYLNSLDTHGTHTIITCTPDNNENTPNTPSYILYKLAVKSPHWKVIDLSFYNELIDIKDSIPEPYHLGQIYGKWYDKDKAEMEKKAAQEKQKQVSSPKIDWTFS